MLFGTSAKPPIIFRRYEFRALSTNDLHIFRGSHLPKITFRINYFLFRCVDVRPETRVGVQQLLLMDWYTHRTSRKAVY